MGPLPVGGRFHAVTDAGGVLLNIREPHSVRRAFRDMTAAVKAQYPDARRFFAKHGAQPLHQVDVVSLRRDDAGDG